MFANTHDQYGLVSRGLHWLIFVVVMGMLMGGFGLRLLPEGGLKFAVMTVHKSSGILLLVLMVARLLWRITNPVPKALGENPFFNYCAHLLHIYLYVLLLLQPLAGILMSQAYGFPVSFFGLFSLPPLVWQSALLGNFFRQVHGVIAILLLIFIGIHLAAALKHHFIDRDRTLLRMIQGR